MPDFGDKASAITAKKLAIAMRFINTAQEVTATGACLHCGEPLRDQLRWCDVDCRDDWQAQQDYLKRNGVSNG